MGTQRLEDKKWHWQPINDCLAVRPIKLESRRTVLRTGVAAFNN